MNPTITNSEQITNTDGTISLPYSAVGGGYVFNDAIVDIAANILALTPEQILSIQQTRFNNWYSIITNPVQTASSTASA